MKYNSIFILGVFVLISLEACKTSKEQVSDENETEILSVQSTPEILMITFSMDSRDSVKVINSMKNPGRLRREFYLKSEPGEGDLIISFLDDSNVVCSKTILENPMIRRFEYSETDDISTLTAKTIELDSAEFFIRVQYDDCFKHLRMEKFSNDQITLLKIIRDYSKPF